MHFLSSIIYPITSTLLYFLPSLCISPSFVQIPNVLYWCSVRCIANTFLMVQTWHCIQFDIESVMQKHYRHKYLSFCPTSLPRSPSVPHTFLFLPDPLPISPSLYFEVCFYFSELIFYIFSGYLSISPSHLGWVSMGEKDRKSTSERLIHENERENHLQWKKNSLYSMLDNNRQRAALFSCCRRHV